MNDCPFLLISWSVDNFYFYPTTGIFSFIDKYKIIAANEPGPWLPVKNTPDMIQCGTNGQRP